MKKKYNLIVFIIFCLFAFTLSVSAYEFPADGQEHEIKAGGGQGTISNCYAVSDNVTVRYDSEAKKCYAKSNTISESGFKASIHLESAGGAYGGRMNEDVSVSVTSASGTSDGTREKVADGNYTANGEWQDITKEVSGAVYGCESLDSSVEVRYENGHCYVKSNSESDVSGKVKVNYTQASSMQSTVVDTNLSGNGGSSVAGAKRSNDELQICDVSENPKIVASFKLVGIIIAIIKIIVPIIIIVMGMFDISKSVIEGKDDSIKKQAISLLKRFVACILIFLGPKIVVDIFHNIDGWDDVESKYSVCADCVLDVGKCPDVKFIDSTTASTSTTKSN